MSDLLKLHLLKSSIPEFYFDMYNLEKYAQVLIGNPTVLTLENEKRLKMTLFIEVME